jgi:hypothetical protein
MEQFSDLSKNEEEKNELPNLPTMLIRKEDIPTGANNEEPVIALIPQAEDSKAGKDDYAPTIRRDSLPGGLPAEIGSFKEQEHKAEEPQVVLPVEAPVEAVVPSQPDYAPTIRREVLPEPSPVAPVASSLPDYEPTIRRDAIHSGTPPPLQPAQGAPVMPEPVYIPPAQSSYSPPPELPVEPPPQKKKTNTWLIIIILLLVLCCCCILPAVYSLASGGIEGIMQNIQQGLG